MPKMLILLLSALLMVVRADECPTPVCPLYDSHLELLQSQLHFSADLLQTIAKLNSTDNVFLSPSSVYNALLITYFSAGGNTTKTLLKTLRIPEKDFTKNMIIGNYFGEYEGNYSQCANQSKEVAPKKYQLSNANRIYASDKLKVKDCMKKLFPKEIQEENFTGDAAGAIKEINSWVAKQTKDMIPKLLDDYSLDSTTKIALVNAVYFNASWELKFPNPAEQDDFHLANGSTVKVMMMKQTEEFRLSLDSQLDATILELPYEGDDVSMFIVLPNKPSVSAISDLLNKITQEKISNAYKKISESQPHTVNVNIPKFAVEREYDLTHILSSMGAGALFNSSADFSTLFEDVTGLAISAAIHKTKIRVTEQGTEAAGATVVTTEGSAGTEEHKPLFRADHPFIYIIYDKPSTLLLFTGIFNSP